MATILEKIKKHSESHFVNRVGWLRAAVLGANDGILSVGSIVSGMAAGNAPHHAIILAGLAGLMAGATSMATGEYVSVSSQADTEKADLAREKYELQHNTKYEQEELAQIYVARGLQIDLARQVATDLMKHDALGAHARDELGITDSMTAKPLQAAMASAASFTAGAFLPLIVVLLTPPQHLVISIIISTLLSLSVLGALGAKTGGVPIWRPTFRVLIWGAVSLILTTLVGILFGVKT